MAARVVARERLGGLLWLTVSVPGWSPASPGQFALLHAEPSSCFLPRAFSVAAQDGDRVSFLIAPVGVGTNELDALRADEPVWVTGPLGNGFAIPDVRGLGEPVRSAAAPGAPPRLVLVAGGVGAAPFSLFLDQWALRAGEDPGEVLVLLGFRDAFHAVGAAPAEGAAARLTAAGGDCSVEVCTEDGSRGPKMLVTELLAGHLRFDDRVLVCGPRPMMEAVWDVCRRARVERAWFSLETNMACGVGSCHGCAVTLADGSLARVCHEGPVFAGVSVYGGEAQ
jgi:dihydroorotate dehydrogenase electron transfer subunit